MSWRTVVVSSRAKLELKNNYLVIRNEKIRRVHLDEISVLLIENTGSAITASLLEALWSRKIDVVFCDRKRNPGAQLIPYYNSHDCSARLQSQIHWNKNFVATIWAEIVRQKILNQSRVLHLTGNEEASDLLIRYSEEVQPDDVSNREGHAAKVYFNALFGSSFSRKNDCYENHILNYGYGVLLSVVNREIVANGYLTQLGLFHSNVYNQFNLSCDLMEPVRPIFDLEILGLPLPVSGELDHSTKIAVIGILNRNVRIHGVKYTLLNAIAIYVHSVLDALDGNDTSIVRFIDNEF